MSHLRIHDEAKSDAQKAVDHAIKEYGETNGAFNYCGFAWVTIKPARGAFVNQLKKDNIGSNGVYGGWRISIYDIIDLPPRLSQSMELKEIGARAYAEALRAHGVKAFAESRPD
jgi:hypothetical protein